jgi:hypothetical protein
MAASSITLVVLFPEKWAKFSGDPNISPALLGSFEAALSGCANATELLAKAEGFCRANQMQGPQVAAPAFLTGRICRQIALEELLTKTLRLRPDDTRQFLAQLASETPAERMATLHAILGSTPMGFFLMWVFRNPPQANDPFIGIDASHLPCQLGLPYNAGDSFVAWGIEVPSGHTLRVPTAFDAGMTFVDLWAPGGTTVPTGLCQTLGMSGFPEFVIRPPTFACARANFLQFRAQ